MTEIFFLSKPLNNGDCVVFVRAYDDATHVGDSTRNRKYEKHIDVIKWLIGEKDFLKNKVSPDEFSR